MNVLYNDEGSLLFTLLRIMPSIYISGVEKRILSPQIQKYKKKKHWILDKDFEDDKKKLSFEAIAGIQD